MKKIFICIAAIAALTFTSCGNSSKTAEAVDSVAVDTVEADLDLEEALKSGDVTAIKSEIEKIKSLIVNGDSAEVNKYKYMLQEFAARHSGDIDSLTNGEMTVDDLIEGIKNLPTTVEGVAGEAKDAATSDAKQVKEEVKTAVKEKANEEADKAVQKANEAANKAVNDAAEAAKKKLGL
ncbi:MAG: hypothetical protein K6E54_11240 [Bacteroidaceae bacterium]|nr:hypothetical protein [Bacteroidaceae bacterium]